MTKKEYDNRDLQIESRLTGVEEGLKEIKTNHLAHLKEDILDVKTILIGHIKEKTQESQGTRDKIDKILWFLITTAFSLASGLAFLIFKLQ